MRPLVIIGATDAAKDGFTVVTDALNSVEVDALRLAMSDISDGASRDGRAGARGLLQLVPEVRVLTSHPSMRAAAVQALGLNCFPVRALLFDKTPIANWKVAWHQDLTIAVRARREVAGYGPWSVKGGVPHVQPPISILEGMVAIRVHLDDCGIDNGPIRVLPGSHRAGFLKARDIDTWRKRIAPVTCTVSRGDLLIMRPLLLHASSSAENPTHRRVIHIEYASADLPGGLEWFEDATTPIGS